MPSTSPRALTSILTSLKRILINCLLRIKSTDAAVLLNSKRILMSLPFVPTVRKIQKNTKNTKNTIFGLFRLEPLEGGRKSKKNMQNVCCWFWFDPLYRATRGKLYYCMFLYVLYVFCYIVYLFHLPLLMAFR